MRFGLQFLLCVTVTLALLEIASAERTDLKLTTIETCGSVLETETATISYKVNASISPNERCVWLIRSPTAVTYYLDVLSFGLEAIPGQTGVIATCLNRFSSVPTNIQM